MATNRLLTLHLEPHADGAPLAGLLGEERGDERYFTGWLELLTLLEEARSVGASEPEEGAGHAGLSKGRKGI
jgi:hypothetical protein